MSSSSIESGLERWVYLALGVLGALALWGALLALSPAVAQAQQATAPVARSAAQSPTQSLAQSSASVERAVVEVRSGDSLWSMSEERLGPNATPQRVARLVERTYLLNRERIGADPTLIFPGQRLLVPTVRSAPSTETPTSPVGGSTAKAGSVGQEAPAAPEEARVAAPGEPAVSAAPRAEARGVSLPEAAPAVPVPAVRETAAEGSSPSPLAPILEAARSVYSTASSLPGTLASTLARYEVRQIMGMGLILVSFAVPLAVALAAIRTRRAARRDKERWDREYLEASYADGAVAAYQWDQEASHNTLPLLPQGAREVPNRGRLGPNGGVEILVATRNRRQRKRQGVQGARGRPRRAASSHRGTRYRRGGGAAGAWNPKIRRLTRRTTHERRMRPRVARSLSRELRGSANTQMTVHSIKGGR